MQEIYTFALENKDKKRNTANKSLPPNITASSISKFPIKKQTSKDSKMLETMKKNRYKYSDKLYLPNKLATFLKSSK